MNGLIFSITYILYSFLGIWRHTSRNLSLNWRVYTPLVIHIRKWFLTTFLWCVEASPWHWALSNFIFALLTCVFCFVFFLPHVHSFSVWKPCTLNDVTHSFVQIHILYLFGLVNVQNTVTATPTKCIAVKYICANQFWHMICTIQYLYYFYRFLAVLNRYCLYLSLRRDVGDVNIFSQF